MPTEPLLPEGELRDLVRRRIEAGRLPLMRPDQIDAGYGRSKLCCVCDDPIDPTKIEYDVTGPDRLRALVFHFACYVIWQRECSELMGERSHSPGEPRETGGPGKPREPSSRCEVHTLLPFALLGG